MLAARENSPEEVSAWSAPVDAAMNAYRQGAVVEWPSAVSRPINYQASSRPVEPTNDLTDMINAVPITEAALNSILNPPRPKRERLNDLPVAYELSRGAMPLRARPPENELFLSYREHAPRLHVNRRYSRSAERRRKGRSRSRSETRRPRSPN
jgi:hypothetical protein